MTERVDLTEDFPTGAARLHHAITSRARMVILRELLHTPGITATELHERLDLSMPMIRDSVRKLRAAGYLLDTPVSGRPSNLVVDRQRLAHDFTDLHLALFS